MITPEALMELRTFVLQTVLHKVEIEPLKNFSDLYITHPLLLTIHRLTMAMRWTGYQS